MRLEHVIEIASDIKGKVRRACHATPFSLWFITGQMGEAVLPLPSGAGVLLFQHLPFLHFVLFLGDGLNAII